MNAGLRRLEGGDPEAVREGFWIALTGHGVALLALLVGIWWQGRARPEEAPHVFELVPVGEIAPVTVPTAGVANARTEPAPEVPRFDMGRLERINPLPPAPAPPPATPRNPPREAVTPRQDPPPETLSIEEFRRRHGRPTPASTQPRQRPAPNVGIDTSAIQRSIRQLGEMREVGAPSAARTAAQQSALDAWAASVNRLLDRAWSRPETLALQRLAVRVTFNVETDGSLTGVRVVSGSGESVMDSSVLAAFRTVGRVPAPPDGQRKTYTLTFELLPGQQ